MFKADIETVEYNAEIYTHTKMLISLGSILGKF